VKRSLVLAGGGMRVAWQAGVLKALEEEGLDFDHVDGSSGGILSAAMLLSGQGADEMCRRWSELSVRDFGSPLPARDYLRGPWGMPALADRDGLIDKVYPALGIDVDAIRSTEKEGTFNVADFTHKQLLAVEAAAIDVELMSAGMSLPIFMTPLHRDGVVYTDAVWMSDANLGEALRRGADEIWLVWCIGNSPHWGDGPLEQYVHMIEMSAMGALNADIETARAAGRDFVLHVIKPDHPLPLDPEYYLGRISSDSLVAMGYRDARAYLASRSAVGVVHDESCTAMTDPPPSFRFVERLSGEADGHEVRLELTVVAPVEADDGPVELAGFLDHPGWGARAFLADGRVERTEDAVTYRASLRRPRGWAQLEATRSLDGGALDLWSDANEVAVRVLGPEGVELDTTMRLGAGGALRLAASLEPVGVHGLPGRTKAIARALERGVSALLHTRSTITPRP
jgi:NTE family protein